MIHGKRGCTIYRKLDCEFPNLPSCSAKGKLLKFNGTGQTKDCPPTATAPLYFWCRPPSGDHPIAWRFTAQSSGPGGRPVIGIHIGFRSRNLSKVRLPDPRNLLCFRQATGLDLGPPMTTQHRHVDFFHTTTGRVMFFAAAIMVLLVFAFSHVLRISRKAAASRFKQLVFVTKFASTLPSTICSTPPKANIWLDPQKLSPRGALYQIPMTGKFERY